MTPKSYLIFDLDGTISEPAEGIAGSINYALEQSGHAPIDAAHISQYIGPPLDKVFRTIVGFAVDSNNLLNDLVQNYRIHYNEVGYSQNVLFEGIPAALEAIRAAGIPMGVCTSKFTDAAVMILELHGVRGFFDFVSGGDNGITKADQFQTLLADGVVSSDSIMIGDRAVDITSARANGLRGVGVLYGHGSREELEEAAPIRLLSSPNELPSLIELL